MLRKVVEGHVRLGQPVGSKWLSEQPDMEWASSTMRAELARLEEVELLRHPHTSAGRVPTDIRYRYCVDDLLARRQLPAVDRPFDLGEVRREVDEAMRVTTEQLSQVTNLLAIVSAPPIGTTTIRRIELLLLQPQLAMVVVITSTGGVSKRLISYDHAVDPGLVDWAGSYLNEALGGMVGARMLAGRLSDPTREHRARVRAALAPRSSSWRTARAPSTWRAGPAAVQGPPVRSSRSTSC